MFVKTVDAVRSDNCVCVCVCVLAIGFRVTIDLKMRLNGFKVREPVTGQKRGNESEIFISK